MIKVPNIKKLQKKIATAKAVAELPAKKPLAKIQYANLQEMCEKANEALRLEIKEMASSFEDILRITYDILYNDDMRNTFPAKAVELANVAIEAQMRLDAFERDNSKYL